MTLDPEFRPYRELVAAMMLDAIQCSQGRITAARRNEKEHPEQEIALAKAWLNGADDALITHEQACAWIGVHTHNRRSNPPGGMPDPDPETEKKSTGNGVPE